MRLKLNRTLRAALIAAFATVGFTLPQSFAAPQTLTLTSPGGAQITGGNQLITWSESTGQLTSWQLNFDMTCSSATDPFIRINGNDGYSVKSSPNSLQITKGFGSALLTLGDLSLGSSTPVTIKFIADVDGNQASLGTGTFYISTGDNTNVVSTKVTGITFASGTGNPSLVSGTSRIWTNSGAEKLYNISVTKLDNNVMVISDCTWQGTEEHHSWSDAASWNVAFTAGSNATFGSAATTKTVDVDGVIEASSVTIDNAEYTFNVANGGTLSATTLSMTGKLTVTGVEGNADKVTIGSLTGTGDLTAGEGSNVTVNALSSYTGAMSVADGGTLNLGGDIVLADLTVADGTVTTTHAGANGVVTNTLTIGQDGTFRVLGEHDAFGYNNGATKNIDMTGAQDHLATLSLEQSTGNSVTMTTNIAMHGYSAITVKEGGKGFNTYNGNITVENKANTIAVIDLRNAVTIDVAKDGELSVGKFTQNGTNAPAVTKTGEGTMTITEASTLPGALNINGGTVSIGADTTIAGLNIAATGSLTVTGGSTSVSGSTNVIGNTISVTGGTLTLTGSYAIDSITGGGLVTDYVNYNGEKANSGFSRKSGSVTVYSQDGGTVDATGATFTLGGRQVTATDGVVTIDTTIDYTTLYANTRTAVDFAAHQAYAQSQGSGITGVVLKNDTIVQNVSGTVGVTLAEGATRATVNASGATTISGISGWSNNMLVIQGNGEVTMAGQTLTGSQKLQVAGTVSTTGALTVNGEGASLVVARDATLNVTGNMTPVLGRVEIQGEVNISHELDLSNGSTAEGTVNIASFGKLSAWGMWMHKGVSVDLEEGGEFSIGQNATKDLTIIGKDGGSVTYTNAARDANYGTNNADYKISNATVTTTGASVTLGNTLENVDVVIAEGSSLTLNTNADSVTVGNGGTFTKGTGATVGTINVEDGGTIAGGVDAKDVGIAAHGTATFDEGVNDEQVGIAIAGWDSGATVTNNGDSTAKYAGLQDENMTVSAEELYSLAESEIVVNNELKVGAIIHCGEGALTLANVNGDALEAVQTDTAALVLQGITETTLTEMTIGIGASVAVYTDSSKATEGTVTIDAGCILTAGEGSTLYANLVLEEGATWNLMGNSMNLGSTLQLATLITLDDATLQNLDDDLNVGEFYALACDASGHGIEYLGQTGVDAWYDGVFSRQGEHYTLEGDFYLDVQNGDFGLVKVSKTPEPTTGTLSLLALAALAARRRRK